MHHERHQDQQREAVREICRAHGGQRGRLMDIAIAVQEELRCVSHCSIDVIAEELSMPRVDIEGLVTFYSFLSVAPRGRVAIRLCSDVPDRLAGVERIAETFCQELGVPMGGITPDGAISIEWTPFIGMSDQAPAALVNDVIVTELSTDAVRDIVRRLRKSGDPARLVRRLGDGNNAHDLVRAMVKNNIQRAGPVLFGAYSQAKALEQALVVTPQEVIRTVKTARLRGRGGAGFPTGMKWELSRNAPGRERHIICNADEGEPGTFKDRVLLTELPDLMVEGMTIAGYAIGASGGILYLRGEYAYLRPFMEHILEQRRAQGLLGRSVLGREGFDFDVTIQLGAGSYVCGEETALISSCEGDRGDPKTRPPFPTHSGYQASPTVVNNVETFCCVARVFEHGVPWFARHGTKDSTGTKLLSVCGDCARPGVYEYPYGVRLSEILEAAGSYSPGAVLIGGPSGKLVGPAAFEQTISYEQLCTGGALVIFGHKRNVVEIARQYVGFFHEESCGYCTPCRVGTVLLAQRLEAILAGRGEPGDLEYLERLGQTMKAASRCGLGKTAPNPVLSTLAEFRQVYDDLVQPPARGERRQFDVRAALGDAEAVAGRESVRFPGSRK